MKYALVALAGTLLIPIPQYGNASLIEIVWFAIGVVALVFSLWMFPALWGDLQAAKAAPDSKVARARVVIAHGYIRREIVRVAQALIIMTLGLFTLFKENPTHIDAFGLFVVGGLVTLAALVAVQSGFDRLQRRHAKQLLDEE